MQRKTRKIVLALVVIGVVAAGGAAFTAGNTVKPSVAGFGSATVTGANANVIHHILSSDGTHILSTTMTLTGQLDDPGLVVQAGFDGNDLVTCTGSNLQGTGVTATIDESCAWASADGADATGYDTATASNFNVAVSGTSTP
jgi:hypothetical protein